MGVFLAGFSHACTKVEVAEDAPPAVVAEQKPQDIKRSAKVGLMRERSAASTNSRSQLGLFFEKKKINNRLKNNPFFKKKTNNDKDG